MVTIEHKKYTLTVYNTVTRRNEEIEVTKEVYHAYCRTGWGIKNNDASFYEHEIQMSGLIGGENGAYENFREFIDAENIPDTIVSKMIESETLRRVLSALADTEKALVEALYFNGLTEREYAKKTGVAPMTFHDRKIRILKKMKKMLGY